ncbi:nucleoside-diphosphate kinase [Candidatus Woesearchaeota archaeon CG10_big_fil_rev_8_21_14_0_10_32_9]|nr:MAG: nucleoside-diphosphate kinase [Candidatus Woesearchaeota archaeon CG10_big_fil_rev_8_21_14_0_10_32_9]
MMNERTLVILKPDAVARGIVGEILTRFEKVGLKIVAMKMIFAPEDKLKEHYFKDDQWLIEKGKGIIKNKGYPENYDQKIAGQEIVDGLVQDMMILPVIAMILEGHNAVNVVRKLVGPTNVEQALPGTIRGDYSHDTYALANVSDRPILTIVHASGDLADAEKEVKLWFAPEEIQGYERADAKIHYRKGNLNKK